jgi:hypothetical protein
MNLNSCILTHVDDVSDMCACRYYDDGDRDLVTMGRSNRASQHSRFSDTVLQVSSHRAAVLEQGELALTAWVTVNEATYLFTEELTAWISDNEATYMFTEELTAWITDNEATYVFTEELTAWIIDNKATNVFTEELTAEVTAARYPYASSFLLCLNFTLFSTVDTKCHQWWCINYIEYLSYLVPEHGIFIT